MPHHRDFAAAASPSQVALRVGLALVRADLTTVWLTYFAVGGNHTEDEVRASVTTPGLECVDHDLLAAALNDLLLDDLTSYRVPYRSELTPFVS